MLTDIHDFKNRVSFPHSNRTGLAEAQLFGLLAGLDATVPYYIKTCTPTTTQENGDWNWTFLVDYTSTDAAEIAGRAQTAEQSAAFLARQLFHASMPLNEDGTLKEVEILGRKYKGKELLNRTGQLIRTAYFADEDNDEKAFALDYIWYLWCGKDSPAFDKSKMATFERYFLVDKSTHKEVKGAYYTLRDREDICDMILDEFGVEGEHRHIINGHVPVKAVKGEKPIKANGKLMVIDGGFSRAYQPETGIAGYTLVYHSRGFQLVQHEPFTSTQKAIEEGQDIKSTTQIVELSSKRMMVKDTDKGRELSIQIEDLKKLLVAYRTGIIKEKAS